MNCLNFFQKKFTLLLFRNLNMGSQRYTKIFRTEHNLEYAASRKIVDSIPDKVTGFCNWHNPSSRKTLVSTQPITEMSTRNLPGGEKRPAHKADNITAICEPTVYKMWQPLRLTNLWGHHGLLQGWLSFLLNIIHVNLPSDSQQITLYVRPNYNKGTQLV
jgi:hypothetical protein